MTIRILSFFCVTLCLLLSSQVTAQWSLRSPRQTVETHLKYLSEEYQTRNNAWRYALYSSYALNNPNLSKQARKDLQHRAVMLKEIYEGLGEYIVFEDIPDNPNYTDSTQKGKNIYTVVSRLGVDIYLEKINGNWYYSKETVENIPLMYQTVFPLQLEKYLGINIDAGEKYLGLTIYQYIGIAVLLFISVFLFKIIQFFVEFILAKVFKQKDKGEVFIAYLVQIARPLSLAFLIIFLRILVRALQLPLEYSYVIHHFFDIAQIVFLTYVAYKAVNILGFYLDAWSQRPNNALNLQFNSLLRKTLRILVVIFGTWAFTETIGWNITGIIAGLSLGGLAVALAAQDTLKNVFGSMMILLDKPFKIGDWIVTDGIEGKVEEIGFRSTRIRTFYNSLITISNAKITDMKIDNMGIRQMIRYRTRISITYDTPPALIEAYIEGIREIIKAHPYTNKENYMVFLHDFAASSLDILLIVHFITPDVVQEFAWRQEILLKVIHLADFLGVRFAFPTSTIHIESMVGQGSMIDNAKMSKEAYQAKVQEFLKQYEEEAE